MHTYGVSALSLTMVMSVFFFGTLLLMWLYNKFPETGALLLRKKPVDVYAAAGGRMRGIE
jgi:hypothetical protein